MSVSLDATGAGNHSAGASSLTANHTCSGSNRVLYVAVESYRTGNHNYGAPTGVTYNGVAMTKIGEAHFGQSDNEDLSLWRLIAPATGTNQIAVTMPQSMEVGFVSWSVNGADQTTPETATPVTHGINQLDGNTATTAVSDAVSSGDTGGMFFDAVAVFNATISSRGSGQTDLVDQSTGGGNDSIYTSYHAGASSATMSETLSASKFYGHIAFCVKAASGAAYTLTASAGSYALTGTAAALKAGRVVPAAAGTYAVTGAAVTLRAGRVIGAGAGSYALTGQDAAFRRTYILVAGGGVYTISGADAGLLRGLLLDAGSGVYQVTGEDVALLRGLRLVADAGSYGESGSDAALLVDRLLAAAAGAYTITGYDASLIRSGGYVLAADAGSYAITGTDAGLLVGRLLSAAAGAYALTGAAAGLLAGRRLDASGGTYALTGADATLLRGGRVLKAGSGSYIVTGISADLVWHGAIVAPTPFCTLQSVVEAAQEETGLDVGNVTTAASLGAHVTGYRQRLLGRCADHWKDVASEDLTTGVGVGLGWGQDWGMCWGGRPGGETVLLPDMEAIWEVRARRIDTGALDLVHVTTISEPLPPADPAIRLHHGTAFLLNFSTAWLGVYDQLVLQGIAVPSASPSFTADDLAANALIAPGFCRCCELEACRVLAFRNGDIALAVAYAQELAVAESRLFEQVVGANRHVMSRQCQRP